MTPEQFDGVKYQLSPTDLCLHARTAVSLNDKPLIDRINAEGARRGMTGSDCRALLAERDQQVRDVFAAVAAVALVAAAAKYGATSSPSYTSSAGFVGGQDYEWDWDQFYNEVLMLTWRCRGVQTGQFADNAKCAGKIMVDQRWPGFQDPR